VPSSTQNSRGSRLSTPRGSTAYSQRNRAGSIPAERAGNSDSEKTKAAIAEKKINRAGFFMTFRIMTYHPPL
jgi:hypothetical protein